MYLFVETAAASPYHIVFVLVIDRHDVIVKRVTPERGERWCGCGACGRGSGLAVTGVQGR